jgi:hypothetical protein
VGFVTPFRSPDGEPDPKRTRLSAHPSPTLPRALIDLQQSLLDVAENGEDEFVDEEGKRYCIDDEPDEELELDSDNGEEEDEDVDSKETRSGNEVLATELKTRPTVTNHSRQRFSLFSLELLQLQTVWSTNHGNQFGFCSSWLCL